MFTGIIESIGSVRAMTPKGGDLRVYIATGKLDLGDVKLGDKMCIRDSGHAARSLRRWRRLRLVAGTSGEEKDGQQGDRAQGHGLLHSGGIRAALV